MYVERIPAGIYAANCYIIGDEKTMKAAIVDPGGDAYKIMIRVKELGYEIVAIILTHGHGDHIGGVMEVKEETNAPVMIHAEDAHMLKDPKKNLSSLMGENSQFEADRLLKNNGIVEVGNLELKIIHTPGHTRGGITISCEDCLFTGDTLFQNSIGRTDFEGGDFDTIIKSIKNKLLVFDDKTLVLSGHGPESTVGHEKKRNPFLK